MTFLKYLNEVDSIMIERTGQASTENMMDDIQKAQDSGLDPDECVDLITITT